MQIQIQLCFVDEVKQKYIKPVFYIFGSVLRNDSNMCENSVTTTVDMKREDVILGYRIGNATNPLLVEVNEWVRSLLVYVYEPSTKDFG